MRSTATIGTGASRATRTRSGRRRGASDTPLTPPVIADAAGPNAAKHAAADLPRVEAASATLARLRTLLPTIGATRLSMVTGLDVVGIPVAMVCRPNSRSLSVAQGKGVDDDAAKVSAIGESLESWHAETVLHPLRLATHRELAASEPVVDPAGLPTTTTSTFHPDQTILWVEGHDILADEPAFLPYELVHLDHRVPRPPGSGAFLNTSTGLASGSHLLEAVSHGLCEVVERDALTLWEAAAPSDQSRRRVDLATVDDPVCRRLLERYWHADVDVAAWDLTTDIGLATFMVMAADRDRDPARPVPAVAGFGCHPSRGVALVRALTEAAQSRLTIIVGSRDDRSPAGHEAIRAGTRFEQHSAQVRRVGPPARAFDEVPDYPSPAVDDDVALTLDRLRAVGVRRVVLVDLTRPDIDVPVVRMVVPGLEGYTQRPTYRPGPRARAAATRAEAAR